MGAGFAASFSGLPRGGQEYRRPHDIRLANGHFADFTPVACGGSCAPANLVWEQNGVVYRIQMRLNPDMKERDQQRILIETANSCVTLASDTLAVK